MASCLPVSSIATVAAPLTRPMLKLMQTFCFVNAASLGVLDGRLGERAS